MLRFHNTRTDGSNKPGSKNTSSHIIHRECGLIPYRMTLRNEKVIAYSKKGKNGQWIELPVQIKERGQIVVKTDLTVGQFIKAVWLKKLAYA